MTIQELAAKAADEIERRGWHQGAFGSDRDDPANCKVCAIGAIKAASSGDPWRIDIDTQVPIELWDTLNGRVGREVVVWNDEPGRTKEEVVALLRSVAAGDAQ